MTSETAETAVAEFIQPVSHLPMMSTSYCRDTEPVAMTTSATAQNVNLACEKDAKDEPNILTVIKVLRSFLFFVFFSFLFYSFLHLTLQWSL